MNFTVLLPDSFKHIFTAFKTLILVLTLIPKRMSEITPPDSNNNTLSGFADSKWQEIGTYLCDECRKDGYCKLNNSPKATLKPLYDLQYYVNMIPLRVKNTDLVKSSSFTQQYMQHGLDAFHQEDYESALLHFRVILKECNSFYEINIAVALCYFYLHDYEQASLFMQYFEDKPYIIKINFVNNFIDICLQQIKNQRQEELVEAPVVLKGCEVSVV